MITGFNMGQMPHFAQMKFKKDGSIPQELVDQLISKAPTNMLENHRVSGTLSNTMVLCQPGFGNSVYASMMNQQLKNQKTPMPNRSYIYAFAEYYRQLNAKTMSFTVNSHSPFLKECSITESLDSLSFMNDNTNLIAIELDNETYYAPQILGVSGTPNALIALLYTSGKSLLDKKAVEKELRKRANAFLDHLENMANMIKARGYKQPIGISVHVINNITSRVWTEEVLKRKFWDFLAPHLYFAGSTELDIRQEFNMHLGHLPKNAEVRITEWNGNSDKMKKLETQSEVLAFIDRVHGIARENKVKYCAMHTLWTADDAFYSFIRSK